MATVFYTVQLKQDGFPVKFVSHGRSVQTFNGPFADPGQACNEFEAWMPGSQFLDEMTFKRKCRELATWRPAPQPA